MQFQLILILIVSLCQVVEFCDDSDDAAVKHYRKANNAQNRYCDMKSSWGVMNETEDFKDGRNLPKQGPAPAPVFTVSLMKYV